VPQFPFAGGPRVGIAEGCSPWLRAPSSLVGTEDALLEAAPGTPEPRHPDHAPRAAWVRGWVPWRGAVGAGPWVPCCGCRAVPVPLRPPPQRCPCTHHASQFGMVSSLVSRDALHARSRSSFLTGRRKGSQGRWGTHPDPHLVPPSTPAAKSPLWAPSTPLHRPVPAHGLLQRWRRDTGKGHPARGRKPPSPGQRLGGRCSGQAARGAARRHGCLANTREGDGIRRDGAPRTQRGVCTGLVPSATSDAEDGEEQASPPKPGPFTAQGAGILGEDARRSHRRAAGHVLGFGPCWEGQRWALHPLLQGRGAREGSHRREPSASSRAPQPGEGSHDARQGNPAFLQPCPACNRQQNPALRPGVPLPGIAALPGCLGTTELGRAPRCPPPGEPSVGVSRCRFLLRVFSKLWPESRRSEER